MMVDYAHVRNALELIQQAESFGMDVGEYPAIKAASVGGVVCPQLLRR